MHISGPVPIQRVVIGGVLFSSTYFGSKKPHNRGIAVFIERGGPITALKSFGDTLKDLVIGFVGVWVDRPERILTLAWSSITAANARILAVLPANWCFLRLRARFGPLKPCTEPVG